MQWFLLINTGVGRFAESYHTVSGSAKGIEAMVEPRCVDPQLGDRMFEHARIDRVPHQTGVHIRIAVTVTALVRGMCI